MGPGYMITSGRPTIVDSAASAQETKWPWQQPQAKVLPSGDLEWAPQPFEFKPGQATRK